MGYKSLLLDADIKLEWKRLHVVQVTASKGQGTSRGHRVQKDWDPSMLLVRKA